jgi:hypothetical protein
MESSFPPTHQLSKQTNLLKMIKLLVCKTFTLFAQILPFLSLAMYQYFFHFNICWFMFTFIGTETTRQIVGPSYLWVLTHLQIKIIQRKKLHLQLVVVVLTYDTSTRKAEAVGS